MKQTLPLQDIINFNTYSGNTLSENPVVVYVAVTKQRLKYTINMQVETFPENYTTGEPITPPLYNFATKIDQAIKRIIEKEGFTQYKINKRCISTNGGNYLGDLFEVDVVGSTTVGKKELNLFIKNILINPDSIKVISVSNAYKTEVFTYKELSKIFEELQEEVNVPSEERYKMVKVYEETDKSAIIMENLAKKGFTTYHRMDVPSLKFMEMCIQNLAKFHGLSFIIKEKRPEYFNNNIKPLKHPYIFGEDMKKLVKDTANCVSKKIDEDMKKKVEQLYKNLVKKYNDYCSDETIKICLCHGDYRPNNIMMKIENDEVSQIIPIDYQLLHYGCPVFDLLYLIYVCTDGNFRRAHMLHLKDLYYDTLDNFLKYFDVDTQKVYPRKEFNRVYEEKLEFGMIIALHVLPFMFAPEDDVPDITKDTDVCFKICDSFNERISEIIEEFTEWGYI